MKRAFIYSGGKYTAEDISFYKRIKTSSDDLIICADGGYDSIILVGIVPDVVIGDMDSIKSKIPSSVKTIVYPKKKDKTDLHLCVDYAIEQDCDEIILLGALGNRIDHSLASLIILRYILEYGLTGMILTRSSRVYLIKDKISINHEYFNKISLIPLTETVEGVTTDGLAYPLRNYTLRQTENLGLSNEFRQNTATIEIKSGLLFVICEEKC